VRNFIRQVLLYGNVTNDKVAVMILLQSLVFDKNAWMLKIK
jgi:hypothetical protein